MRPFSRAAALMSLVSVLTVGGLVVTISPASALGGNYDPAGFALNGDPLVAGAAVAGITGLNGVMSEGQLAGTLLNKIRYSSKWTAITSRLGFGAAQIQADATAATQLAQMETAYAPIATKFAPLIKFVGVAGQVTEVALVAKAGITLGASIDRIAGVDVTGGLCASSVGGFDIANQILANVTDSNCTEYKMGLELAALTNAGEVASTDFSVGAQSCVGTLCLTLVQRVPGVFNGGQTYWCVQESPNDGTRSNYTLSTNDLGSTLSNGPDSINTDNFLPAGSCPSYTGSASAGTLQLVQVVSSLTNNRHTVSWQLESNGAMGGPVNQVTTSADPSRTLRCDVTMKSGEVLHNSTVAFKESTHAVPPPVCPAVPPEMIPISSQIWETGGSQGDIPWTPVTPTTPEYQADRAAHPDCTLGQCRLNLIRVSDGLQCLDAGATCDGWFTDPAKTSKYKCVLGPYQDMGLEHCNAYAPTFNQQKVAAGTPYANPTTGAEVAQTAAVPSGDPTPGTDAQTGRCFPTGWGVFNPVEWVLDPVGCALQWAFVPPPAAVTGIEAGVSRAWNGSTPGKLVTEMESELPDFRTVESGCDGVLINFPQWSASGVYATSVQHVLAACPGDYFARWAPLFSFFIGGSFSIVGILGAKRLVSALFGFHDPGVGG